MKKLLIVALFALPAFAQESYSVNATAPQVAVVDAARTASNVDVCSRNGLPANCTQAQVDALPAPKQGGTVYADSLAGRQAFLRRYLADSLLAQPASREALRRYRWSAATQAQRDAYCVDVLGESAGCDPFAR